MNKKCAKCDKTVYPVEELKCLEKIWHKTCFKCQVCNMTLSMKNYKGFEKLPYCGAHVPKAKATVVADTPENKRLAENSKVQSNVKYHAEFEASKGKFTQIADDPETLRIKANSDVISNITYHDVKGHKDDMEKKRSLQGGGENVRTAEEVREAETVKNINQEQARPSQDHTSRMSQDYGRDQHEQQVRMPQDNHGYGMPPGQPQPQRSMSSSYSAGSNSSSRSNTAMSNSYNNARNQPPPYANPPQQQTYHQQQLMQQQQQQYHHHHQQQQQQQQQQQHHQQQQQQLQQQQMHLQRQQQLHQQQLHQQQLHQQQLHQQQLLQQQQMRKMAEHGHKMGHQGQVSSGVGYGMKSQQSHGHPASQSHYQDKRIITNSQQQQQQHYNQGGRGQQNSAPHSRQSNRCYQAMYDYEAQDSDEVSFRDGDIIIDAVFIDEGWMTGTVHRTGKSGMLPANYVEPVNL